MGCLRGVFIKLPFKALKGIHPVLSIDSSWDGYLFTFFFFSKINRDLVVTEKNWNPVLTMASQPEKTS